MAKFGELSEYFDPGLTLTVLGKEYVLPLPSAELGLWCRHLVALRAEISEESTSEELHAAAARIAELPELPGQMPFEARLLGDVHAQMAADKVPEPYINFCAFTTLMWIIGGEGLAERFWTTGGKDLGEAPGPDNRADRRAAARNGGRSGDAATATQSPASTSGTSSQRRSSGRRGRSRGRRSSPTGG